ncbi:MAG: DUF4864 domain-containing protein [Pseudomonadota bacterium]
MRLITSLAIVFALLTGPAFAQESDPEIPGVIQSQIDAFLQDDFATAFGFASPGIKRFFGSPDRFGQMVRQGYPMVWRPGDVQFLDQEPKDGAIHQKVLITDRAGVQHVLDYQMIPTDEGWQINGVQILRAPGVGA